MFVCLWAWYTHEPRGGKVCVSACLSMYLWISLSIFVYLHWVEYLCSSLLLLHGSTTNYYKLSHLTQHPIITSWFLWVRNSGTAWLVLRILSHKAADKVLSGAVSSSKTQGPLPSSCGCWQNVFPCNSGQHAWLKPAGKSLSLWPLDLLLRAHLIRSVSPRIIFLWLT